MLCMLLAAVSLCGLVPLEAAAASANAFDELSADCVAKSYLQEPAGRTIPYADAALTTRGTVTYGKSSSSYIDNAVDDFYVFGAGVTSGKEWVIGSYPVSGGKRVVAYLPMSAITDNDGPHTRTVSSGKFHCAIRENSALQTKYYVAAGDIVYLLSTSGSKYQIMYQTSTGWRIAFCDPADYEKYCGAGSDGASSASASPAPDGAEDLVDVTELFAGKTLEITSVENGKKLGVDPATRMLKFNQTGSNARTRFVASALTADGWIGLKCCNGNYVSGDLNEINTPFVAKYGALLSWECIRIYMDQEGKNFYILSQSNQKWMCCRRDLTGAFAQAYGNRPSTWERLSITCVGEGFYVSPKMLVATANLCGIPFDSDAFEAMKDIELFYAKKMTSSQKAGTAVFLFEGVGMNASKNTHQNAMCLLVRNGAIIFENRNSSTVPDYYQNPHKNQGTPVPTLKSGMYSFKTVNHRGKYAALNVLNAQVIRFSDATNFYNSTSDQINIHRPEQNTIYGSTSKISNSDGCLLVGAAGKASTGEYARFIQALGIVGPNARGDAKFVKGQEKNRRRHCGPHLCQQLPADLGLFQGCCPCVGLSRAGSNS